jgi:hypothetical protein
MSRFLLSLVGCFIIFHATGLFAQSVRGTLIEAGTGAPIGGAVIVLSDQAGAQVGGTLTDADGRFLIQAPQPGRYRLKAERIGFRSATSASLQLVAGQVLEYRMEISSQAIQLTGIVARGERRCTVRPAEGLRTAAVWEEARKALSAARLAQEQDLLRYQTRTYQRTLDPEDLRVREESVRSRTEYGTRPYVSRPAEALRERGFVQTTSDGTFYYAPDAEVLLSGAFLDTHCFRPSEGENTEGEAEDRIGLAFEPVRGRRVPEIRGTFWLDPETAALQALEYRYVNLDLGIPTDQLGGRVEFEQLPGGAWIVRRWAIRMPEIGLRRSSWRGQVREEAVLTGLREEGGEVVRLFARGQEVVGPSERATLAGMVYDSTRAAALTGAQVRLSGTEHAASTDTQGRFRMEDLPEGRYAVEFSHPRLDSLGVVSLPPQEAVLKSGEETFLDLAVPSMTRLLAAACPQPEGGPRERGRMRGDEIGVLVGTVRDALTGAPIPGATVRVGWSRYEVEDDRRRYSVAVRELPASFEATTDAQGRYRMCEVPALLPLTVQAGLLGREGPEAQTRIASPDAPALQDLTLSLAAPARVLGRVVDFETGAPIASATVRLEEAGLERLTDEQGRFTFPEVPPGPHEITLAHLAYGEHAVSIRARGGDTLELHIRLPQTAIALEGVVATARSRRAKVARMRATPLRLLDRDDIDELGLTARHVGDLVRTLPGLTVREGGHADSGICIEATQRIRSSRTARRCEMVKVYVDDVPLPAEDASYYLPNLPLGDIESIEYLKPMEAGARYGTGAGQGVLLIYTRGNGLFVRERK